jgi:hypothetical protein
MPDHALAGPRCSPLLQAILRFGVASTTGLLLIACLFLAGRRLGGAFDQPLSSPSLLFLGLAVLALAGCLRTVWPRVSHARNFAASWARLLLPSLAVFLFCFSLTLPGSAPWAVGLLWFLVVCAEGAWWLANSFSLPSGRQRVTTARPTPTASRAGTDTDSIFQVREGVPSALVSLPLRCMHSVVETADYGDVEETIKLMAGFVLSLKPKDLFHHEL